MEFLHRKFRDPAPHHQSRLYLRLLCGSLSPVVPNHIIYQRLTFRFLAP